MANKGGERPLAEVYAQALYEAAGEAGTLNSAADELDALQRLLKADGRVHIFLEAPSISFEAKRKVIEATLTGFSQITLNFMLVLTQRGRTGLLGLIAEAFQDCLDVSSRTAAVEVSTARPMDDGERANITTLMQKKLGKNIRLTEKVRPELLGGMLVRHGDTNWDSTVSRKLQGISAKLHDLKALQGTMKD